jgi:hypothetical protein
LVTALGKVPSKWIGAAIGIYVDHNVPFAGKITKGLRLRVLGATVLAKPALAPAPAPTATGWQQEEKGDPGFQPDTGNYEPV